MKYDNNKYLQGITEPFVGRTNNTLLQLFRYTFAGGIAFIIDFGTLFLLTEYFDIYYLLSAGIGFLLGLIINYILSIIWVFSNRSMENHVYEFITFTIIGLVGLVLNELFLWLLTNILSIFYLISKIITAAVILLWNFSARKRLLFRNE